jgi:hypothetical protein
MEPIFFKPDNGVSLIIFPENKGNHGGLINTFQLYHGNSGNLMKCVNDLNNYSGLISFEQDSQEFYYTPGNLPLSTVEILQVMSCIKTKIRLA